MTALKLNGRQISNLGRLLKNFSAAGIITQRRAFSSFADAHLKYGDISRYHAAMFAAATEAMDAKNSPIGDGFSQNDYWDNPLGLRISDDALREILRGYQNPGEADSAAQGRAVSDALFALVGKTTLVSGQKRCLFYLLTAGYLISGVSPEDSPSSPEELEDAFTGKKRGGSPSPQAGMWAQLPEDSDEMTLPARNEGYRFRLFSAATLPEGGKIRTFRVTAAQPKNGSRYLSAKIELYLRAGDTSPEVSASLKPGEFLYLNAVGGEVIKLLSAVEQSGDKRLGRPDLSEEGLYLSTATGMRKLAAKYYQGASSFAVENDSEGYLVIQNYRLNSGAYSNRESYAQFSSLEYRRSVEVAIMDGEYAVLQDNGRVYSSNGEWDRLRGLPTLDIIKKGGAGL